MIYAENTLKRKETKLKKYRSVSGGKVSKPLTRSKVIIMSETMFPTRDFFLQTSFQRKKLGSLFGYVQRDLVVPDELKSKFAKFSPICNKTENGRKDIGDYMKNPAIDHDMLKHPQRLLISSFKLENETVILLFSTFIWNLECSAPKLTVLFKILPGNALIISFI